MKGKGERKGKGRGREGKGEPHFLCKFTSVRSSAVNEVVCMSCCDSHTRCDKSETFDLSGSEKCLMCRRRACYNSYLFLVVVSALIKCARASFKFVTKAN